MKDSIDNLVVVLSRNYPTGLSVIRSLGAAGYTVDLVASAYKAGNSEIAAKSKYVRHSVEVVSKKVKNAEDVQLLEELLKYAGTCKKKPVLFPTDDYTTSVMDQNREKLEEIFIMPTIVGGGDGCLTKCMDKTFQAALAKEAGLLTPQEWIFSLEEEIEIPEEMIYPCFCKPIESVSGYKKEMAVCQTAGELRRHLKKLKRKFSHRHILVQEFLEIDYEIDLSGVCIDQEIIIPAIIKKTNVAKYERGVTLAGKIVPFEEIGEIQEKIVHMLKAFHYVGMFDMEFNVVGDKIYFNEVNLRSGGPNYSYFASGVNLPKLFVKAAKGETYSEAEKSVKEYGKTFVYEKVAWDDYFHGFMTKKELKECIQAADITLLCNKDDKEPGRIFEKNMVKRDHKNKLKKAVRLVKREIPRKIVRKIKRTFRQPLRRVKYKLLGYPQSKAENKRCNSVSDKPRVIVAGRNYCSNLCMARSLGEAGYEVEILKIFQTRPHLGRMQRYLKPDAYSKYVKAYHICVTRRKSYRIIRKLERIADKNRKMLLIPADDLVANVADEYYDRLSEKYYVPNVNEMAGEIQRLMGKGEQKKLAEEAELPVLNSCVIKAYHGKFEIPESVNYPCFVKPNISKNSSKNKMRRCENEEELRECLTEFSARKRIEMLVEDFVEIDQEYAILGLSTKECVVSPGFFVTEIGGHKERRGVALQGRVLPCSEEQELIDKINAFIKTLNFEGLFDVDLIKTKEGKMYFVELNLRFGASGYAITKSGANLPGMFADYMLLNKPVNPDCAVKETGKYFVSEKILFDECLNGYVTKKEKKELLKSADIHFIMNEQDPLPYKHFCKCYKAAPLLNILSVVWKKVKKLKVYVKRK